MKKDYNFFHNLLISWWQGIKTKPEIIKALQPVLEITKISQWSDFINDFEESLRTYDEAYFFKWMAYKEYAKDTAPTIRGLIHSIEAYQSESITTEDFIHWACWHNGDCGETTSGVFENSNIEYFCLFFLPHYYKKLDLDFYSKAISIISKSNELSYGAFVIAINLLVEKEKKSLYFFLKSYLEGNKSDDDLNAYLKKKFNVNLPNFKFDLSTFPYKKDLKRTKEQGGNIDSLLKIMEK
ncbi:MAG: hypothetical protein ACFB0B_09075 [Thermonemataceae bacterium]